MKQCPHIHLAARHFGLAVTLCASTHANPRGIRAMLRAAGREIAQADRDHAEFAVLRRRQRKAAKLAERGHYGQIHRLFGGSERTTTASPELTTQAHLWLSTPDGPRLDPFKGGAGRVTPARDSGRVERAKRARVETDEHGCVPVTEAASLETDWSPRVYEQAMHREVG
jgi:hypothetical protein